MHLVLCCIFKPPTLQTVVSGGPFGSSCCGCSWDLGLRSPVSHLVQLQPLWHLSSISCKRQFGSASFQLQSFTTVIVWRTRKEPKSKTGKLGLLGKTQHAGLFTFLLSGQEVLVSGGQSHVYSWRGGDTVVQPAGNVNRISQKQQPLRGSSAVANNSLPSEESDSWRESRGHFSLMFGYGSWISSLSNYCREEIEYNNLSSFFFLVNANSAVLLG